MESYLFNGHYDLITPDGYIVEMKRIHTKLVHACVRIENISPAFLGFHLDQELVFFNIKSSLAQLGLDAHEQNYHMDKNNLSIDVHVHLTASCPLAEKMLSLLQNRCYIGKLFAADPRRRVRNPEYIARMFGRSDRSGQPLLSLGGMQGSNEFVLEKIDGRTVAFLTLKNGRVFYEKSIENFLPSFAKALQKNLHTRELLQLHQQWHEKSARCVQENEILLVKTLPLHIRTVFAVVVNELLGPHMQHTSAKVLQPDTSQSGDIYELYGNSSIELTDIPLEFYTLEPHREHVFFEDRDQLQECIEDSTALLDAFGTAPKAENIRCSVFIVKGTQLKELRTGDWIARRPRQQDFPGVTQGQRQALMVERYIQQQPSYPFLKAIEDGLICSQGILLSRFFPSPLMKRMLLSEKAHIYLKGIYFQYPSSSNRNYFSQEDRAFLLDLAKFGIPTYWVDSQSQEILEYVHKPGKESGMFVPKASIDAFLKSTVFGIYGSNLLSGDFESELNLLFEGLLKLQKHTNHALLNENTPLALLTGGGPGAMEVGNRVAKNLDILSCANIVDFSNQGEAVVNEQTQNSYIDAKMTYRLDKLVERQAEFLLDFPIFLKGGIGTDFEYTLEEVRRKVGTAPAHPVMLFGPASYWEAKITPRFQSNLKHGTIQGSEWISNCFFSVEKAKDALEIYENFFSMNLAIGKKGPIYEEGFVDYAKYKKHLN